MTKTKEILKGKGLFWNKGSRLGSIPFYNGLTLEWYRYTEGVLQITGGHAGILADLAVFIAPRELLQWED